MSYCTSQPRLTGDQQLELFRQLRGLPPDSEEARAVREELVTVNLPLVKRIASRYSRRPQDYEARVSDGAVGLLKAVDGFDPSKGFQFSTFAVPALRRAMIRGSRTAGRAVESAPPESLPDPPDLHDDLRTLEDRQYIDYLMKGLNPREKKIIRSLADGQSLNQIARNLGVSQPTATKMYRKAQQKCREAAADKGRPHRGSTYQT